jgi:RNA-directed DNA polymerase
MKRSAVGLDDIAAPENLIVALRIACRGKARQPDVARFRRDADRHLPLLGASLLEGTWQPSPLRAFGIRDPKPRLIHAPAFHDRVAHHAIMAVVGPVLDRGLVFDTYACRTGKGTLAAVQRAASHAARYTWFVQIDIKSYFPSIDHVVLTTLLARRFRNAGVLGLLGRIVGAHEAAPGRGLPIGSLTSQHFANFYLNGADRLLLETCGVRGYVRYMDDMVWWCDDRASARAALAIVRDYLADRLRLTVKVPVRIGQSRHGLNFLGFRVLPDRLQMSRRRRQR